MYDSKQTTNSKRTTQGEADNESSSSDSSSLHIDAILDSVRDDSDSKHDGSNGNSSNKNNNNKNGAKTGARNTGQSENRNDISGAGDKIGIKDTSGGPGRGSLYEEGNRVQKLEALRWLDVFVTLGGKRLKNLYPNILNSVLFAMNDSRIQQQAEILNEHLMQLILTSQKKFLAGMASKSEEFDIHSVLDVLIKLLENENCVIYTRIASLKWLSNLLIDLPISEFETRVQRLISVCFARLSDENDFVVDMDLCVIARIALHPTIYEQLLKDLLKKFYNDSHLLHFRGKLILTKLCQLLDCKEIYCFLSNLILKEYFGPVIDAANTKKFLTSNSNNYDKNSASKHNLNGTINDKGGKNDSMKNIVNNNNSKNNLDKKRGNEKKKLDEKNKTKVNDDGNNDDRQKLMIEDLFESENKKMSSDLNDSNDGNDININDLDENVPRKYEMKISRRLIFVQNIVRLMNLILLTSEELYPLREMMKQCSQHGKHASNNSINMESRQIFEILYKTWCVSPISLVSLCLLSQEYELGIKLINQFKTNVLFHKSVQFLVEVDELVHLLESPIFVHLRLQLLLYNSVKISKNELYNKSYEIQQEWKLLFRIFNDLLTLLPDSDAYYQLKTRIETISIYNRLFTMLGNKKNTNLKHENGLENAFFWKKFNENDIYYSNWMQFDRKTNSKTNKYQRLKLDDISTSEHISLEDDGDNINNNDSNIVIKKHRSRKERFSKIDLIVASSDDLLNTQQLFEQFLKVNQQISLLKQK